MGRSFHYQTDEAQISEFVNVLDIKTREITRVLARELSPEMIEVQAKEVEGTVWIDGRKLQVGDYEHPPFGEDRLVLIREIKSSVDEFYNLSLEEWEDDLRRVDSPDFEILVWRYFARTYRSVTMRRELDAAQRRDYFELLRTCMVSAQDVVLHRFTPNVISAEETQAAIATYFDNLEWDE